MTLGLGQEAKCRIELSGVNQSKVASAPGRIPIVSLESRYAICLLLMQLKFSTYDLKGRDRERVAQIELLLNVQG